MMKKNKLLPFIIFPILLNSCLNNNGENNITKNKTEIKEKNGNTTNKTEIKGSQLKLNENLSKKLKISDKCTGCWRCVMTDSNHFKINTTTFKPDIINQNDIDSSSTQNAINNCPVDAISIS